MIALPVGTKISLSADITGMNMEGYHLIKKGITGLQNVRDVEIL